MQISFRLRFVMFAVGGFAAFCGLATLGFNGVAKSASQEAQYRSTTTPVSVQCAEVFSEFKGFATITGRTGKFSPSTGERLSGTAASVTAHFEGFDGKPLPGLGPNPQQMFLFPTESGRIVARFLHWAGPY